MSAYWTVTSSLRGTYALGNIMQWKRKKQFKFGNDLFVNYAEKIDIISLETMSERKATILFVVTCAESNAVLCFFAPFVQCCVIHCTDAMK